jgi:hypothetical protein
LFGVETVSHNEHLELRVCPAELAHHPFSRIDLTILPCCARRC